MKIKKEVYDYINENLNKENYFDIVLTTKKNQVMLVWQNSSDVFAIIYTDVIEKILSLEEGVKDENK